MLMKFMDKLYVKIICPSCIQECNAGDCDIVSTITSGKTLKAAPTGGLQQHLARLNPEPLTGHYALELASRRCPHCGYNLPPNIERVQNLNIAVVGDTYSGKTHYIAALIHQIQRGDLQRADRFARIDCLTQEVEEKYKQEVMDPLFRDKQMPDSTQPAFDTERKPLIYEMVISPSPEHPTRHVNLLLYDVSGEDLAQKARLMQFSRYVLNASAIIFLADPASMPEIFKQLPPFLQPSVKTGRTSSGVLNSIVPLLERYRGLTSGSRLSSMPIAVTLSKADLLKQLTPIQNPFTFLSRPTYNGTINLREIDIIDREVKNLLLEYGENALLQATSNLSCLKFFAASATGYAPDKHGQYPAVEPNRCLDPVIWILHRLGILLNVQ